MQQGSEEKCEPNLTPLLDLVLQLIMFFMITANFIMEQVNEAVKLPVAISARSLDKNQNKVLYINLTAPDRSKGEIRGSITVSTGTFTEEYKGPIQLADGLKLQAEKEKLQASPTDWALGKGRSIIILRADKDSIYKHVNEIMMAARSAGYVDVQLRALKK